MPETQTIDDFYVGAWKPAIGEPWQVLSVDGPNVSVLPHFIRNGEPIPMAMTAFDRWRKATGAVKL